MKHLVTLLMLVLLFGGWTTDARAQVEFQGGLNFTTGFPQGEFNENINTEGFGGSGYFLYKFPVNSFSAGIAINYLVYGSETREEPLGPSIPDVRVDVTTTNDILYTHLLFRVQPPAGILRPYLDGLLGLGHFTTDTKVEDQNGDGEDDEIASTNHKRDTALNYGFGGGIMIRLYDGRKNFSGLDAVNLDLGFRYLKGGEAQYLKEGSIDINNGNVNYQVLRSETDIITAHLGVTIDFSVRKPGR